MSEAYTEDAFWELYAKYAEASRDRHSRAARLVTVAEILMPQSSMAPKVLDLGAGRAQICRHVFPHMDYTPVDQIQHTEDTRALDFRDLRSLCALLEEIRPDFVTSFFAVDVVLDWEASQALITTALNYPFVQGFLSAGFFYDDERRSQAQVEEAGGLVSHQVPKGLFSPELEERRYQIQAPSELFGPDVIEVFRFLRRR